MLYNHRMVRSLGKRHLHPIIAAVLGLVVLGTFVFLRSDIFHDSETNGKKPFSNGTFAPVDYTIDWLAENSITVNRTKRASSYALRNGVQRVLLLLKIHRATENLVLFPIHTENHNYLLNNNVIPLRLRI